MIISVNWLKEYLAQPVDIDQLVSLIGSRLVEIESVSNLADKYRDVIIARVVDCVEHPNSDHLHICRIDDGGVVDNVSRDDNGYVQVVCGAPNVRTGLMVAWLPPEAIVPESYGTNDEFRLSSRKLRGVMSYGMLASPRELGLWNEHDGIMELHDDSLTPGARLADYLRLDDYLLEVENKSLTHRPDCFGVIGFAREVAAIMGQSATIPQWFGNLSGSLPNPEQAVVKPTVTIADHAICSRYECVALDEVDSKCSLPDYWRSLIGRIGTNSISAPVDITNYLMFETGQPLHAFDLDKVMEVSPTGAPDIVVRLASEGETLELLDGRVIDLDPRDIIIAVGSANNSVPIGLAGAMGGKFTEITNSTKRVLLESATFDLYHLRGTQFRHGIFSEAITRFTKGQPAELTHPVLLRAVDMLCQYANARVVSRIADARSTTETPAEFKISLSLFSNILGQYDNGVHVDDYDAKLIGDTLRNLQYRNVVVANNIVQATAPWWRTDLHINEDVVEDIGRVNGYDNIAPTSPLREYAAAPYDRLYQKQMWLRDRLVRAGGNEIMTYSFIHGDLLDRVHDDKTAAYRIVNAISPDLQYYRRDLLPSLLEKARDNLRANYHNFMLFELGKVHRRGLMDPAEPTLPAELPEVSAIIVDKAPHDDSAYYTAKLVLQYALSISDAELNFVRLDKFDGNLDSSTNLFEPQRSAVVCVDGGDQLQYIGVVGELKDDVRRHYKLPQFTSCFSLLLNDVLLDNLDNDAKYTPVLRYQGTSRDITYRVSDKTTYRQVADFTRRVLKSKSINGIIAEVTPKDIYDTDDGARNITMHIDFHDANKTIDAKLVGQIMDRLAKQARNEINAEVI